LIEQQARVLHLVGSSVRVRIGGQSGCSACDEGKGCGAGLFGRMLRRKPIEMELPNSIGASDGQAVQLGLSESLFLKLVFRLYGWPLIAALVGGAAGFSIAGFFDAGTGLKDIATLVAAILLPTLVLIFRNRTSRKDVSTSDIQLLNKPVTGKTCDS
jgi:sigma-E factor negative regulatory protein RseC